MKSITIPMSLLSKLKVGQKLIIDKNNKSWIQDTGSSQPPLTQQLLLDLSTALSTLQQANHTLEKRTSGLETESQLKVKSASKP